MRQIFPAQEDMEQHTTKKVSGEKRGRPSLSAEETAEQGHGRLAPRQEERGENEGLGRLAEAAKRADGADAQWHATASSGRTPLHGRRTGTAGDGQRS